MSTPHLRIRSAFSLAVFAIAAAVAASAGFSRLERAAAADADASALQLALLTARFTSFAAEQMELREVARLQKLVAATAGGGVKELAIVTEAADPRFPLTRGKHYLVHTNPAKASGVLRETDAGDAEALEASRQVMDRASAGRPYVRANFRGGVVTAGVAIVVRGAPVAAAIAQAERAPREGFPPVRPFALAGLLGVAFFAVVALSAPAIRHVAAVAALAAIAGFSLTGRDQLTDLNLARVAERAQLIAACHDRLAKAPEGAPPAAAFLDRMQASDPRPFLTMARVDAPFNAPAPVDQLRAGDAVTVPVAGLAAAYTFTLPPGTAARIAQDDRDTYAAWVGWGALGAAALYLAAALVLGRPWRQAAGPEGRPS